MAGIVLIFGAAIAQDLTRDLPPVVQDEVAKIGGRGTAAVIASAARSTGVEGDREYQLEAWSNDDSGVRSGTVRIKAFADLPSGDLGDVRWRITGKEIRGYLIKDGANVASFSGVIAEGGAEERRDDLVGRGWVVDLGRPGGEGVDGSGAGTRAGR